MSKGKIYLAGPWKDRWGAKAAADRFVEAGFTITREWWFDDEDKDDHDPADCALHDWLAVESSDAVVVWNTILSEGKAFEQGIALANDIPICLIGRKPLNIFQHMLCIEKVDTIEEAINWASEIMELKSGNNTNNHAKR